jgi:hypothetical protein
MLSYLNHTHNFVWTRRDGQVWIACRCGVKSPTFDELAEWLALIDWANTHTRCGKGAASE